MRRAKARSDDAIRIPVTCQYIDQLAISALSRSEVAGRTSYQPAGKAWIKKQLLAHLRAKAR